MKIPTIQSLTINCRCTLKKTCLYGTLVFLGTACAWAAEPFWQSLYLDYPDRGFISEAPAEDWDDSLISGNGTIGVSIPGQVPNDGVILSHERLFLPAHKPMPAPPLGSHLDDIRDLILQGKHVEAARFAAEIGQEMGYPSTWWTNPFVPACVLQIESVDTTQGGRYARSVDFETGEIVVAWEKGGEVFHRKTFVSRPAGIAAMLITSPSGARIDATFRLEQLPREEKRQSKYDLDEVIGSVESTADSEWLSYTTRFASEWPGALQGVAAVAQVIPTGGHQQTGKDFIKVTGADQVLILVVVDVFQHWPKSGSRSLKPVLQEINEGYEQLLAEHASVHGPIFRRARLEMGPVADQNLSAEALLASSKEGSLNPALVAKLFDAARYNTICSTGELPPTLQGIWGATWNPPWSGDFTQDGNVQSTIDGGLNCNFPEVTRAYLDYMTSLLDDFRANAKEVFGCNGIWVPSRTSNHGRVYHFSEKFPGLYWIAGAAWVSQYYYDYWLYSGDKTFLETQALPFMLESVAFYLDYLNSGPDGKVMINPSYSPEIWPANLPKWSSSTINATMDVASIKGLLRNLIALSAEVSLDPGQVNRWHHLLARMPDYEIEPETGELKEWCWPNYKNNNLHRHASHLYPMFFGLDPEIANSPELIEASRRAIESRMAFRRQTKGKDVMAFGLVQIGMAAAHIKDSKLAYEVVDMLCNRFWTRGLVSTHNENSGFNVDICGGMPAVIAETLLQSSAGHIELLPVLPEAWPSGSVHGLRTRGGFEIDMEWEGGELVEASVKSLLGKPCRVTYHDMVREIELRNGESIRLDRELRPLGDKRL